jgi:phenylpropionate dioxygenase-like ring-hydroxylating dioxygenase large terminal subunit
MSTPELSPRGAASLGREQWDTWPTYAAAVLGFRNYWYPVAWSGDLRRGAKPLALTLLGDRVMLLRDEDGQLRALRDRCPHRGVPLSLGKQEIVGTWSCIYHGWTYDLATGGMVACLTDGPDSPLVGRVRVPTYPLAERLGLIWIYMGDTQGTEPPVEADIPGEWLEQPVTLVGRIAERAGNWRYAAENGFDEGHAKYLHRDSAWTLFRKLPAYNRASVAPSPDGHWITRIPSNVAMVAEYPVVGQWPRNKWWKRGGRGPSTSIRLPGLLRVDYGEWAHYEWYIPTVEGRHRYLQVAAKRVGGLDGLRFRLNYWLYTRWVFHGAFNDQDAAMVETMQIPPERLYRPDVSIIAWRKLCEQPRGAHESAPAFTETVREQDVEASEPADDRETARSRP